MPDRISVPPPFRPTWSEVLVELDGHLHDPAHDCRHRVGVDACRVCCPHDDDRRITDVEPVDSDWRDDDLARARVLVWLLLAVAAVGTAVAVSALTLAGVIPS